MEETEKIYSLKLHEDFISRLGISIMRVPGGWLYDSWDLEKDSFKQGVFIPYNNEFQIIKKDE